MIWYKPCKANHFHRLSLITHNFSEKRQILMLISNIFSLSILSFFFLIFLKIFRIFLNKHFLKKAFFVAYLYKLYFPVFSAINMLGPKILIFINMVYSYKKMWIKQRQDKNTNKQTKMIVVSFTVSISINAFLNTIIISPIIFIPRTQEK